MGRTYSTHEHVKETYKIEIGKLQRTRPLLGARRRWEDNIKPNVTKAGCEGVDCIQLAL
jgi:hypothetical protein